MNNPKIDVNAIEIYTPELYPKLFKQVGVQGLAEIQKHDQDSAELVSKKRFYVVNRIIQK